MILLLFILFALFLPSPWNVVALVCGVLLEIVEVVWGRRLARRWRPKTGPETAVGRTAQVVEACRPTGMVRVQGELWQATCAAGADVGQTVRVTAVRELMLDVEPVEDEARAPARPGEAEASAGP